MGGGQAKKNVKRNKNCVLQSHEVYTTQEIQQNKDDLQLTGSLQNGKLDGSGTES